MKLLSWVPLCNPTDYIICQSPLSMELYKQEYWNGLPCPPPGTVQTQGINPDLPHCRQILHRLSHQGSCNRTILGTTSSWSVPTQ